MFFVTSINPQRDLVRVFDTEDGSNDITSLSVIANQVLDGKLRVYGIGSVKNARRKDVVLLSSLGIYICINEAKEALATELIKKGFTKESAYAKVGLTGACVV